MIRASVEITGNNSAFSIAVYAENLRQAVEFAASRFPGRAVSVRFPLDPEVFFVEGPAIGSETVGLVATKGSQQERCSVEAAGIPAARRRWGATVDTATDLLIRERASL